MGRRFIVCIFALVAFSASAAHGVHGGHNGQSVSAGADGGNGSNGGDIDNSSGRAGCPGGTDPDKHGHFYLPWHQRTLQSWAPGCRESRVFPLAFSSDRAALCPAAGKAEYPETQPPVRHAPVSST